MNNYLLVFILSSFVLVFFLFGRYRNRRYVPLLLSTIVLILLNVILVNQLTAQTFKSELNCVSLIDRPLNLKDISLCKGLATDPIGPLVFLGPLKLPTVLGITEPWTISILPSLAKTIDPLLADFRPFIARTILIFFALASLFLTLIGGKIIDFVNGMQTPEGVKSALTDLSLWLLFFVILCGLFYAKVVVAL